jgi:hypothetical protein
VYTKNIAWDSSSLSTTMSAFVATNYEYYKALGYLISNVAQVLTVVPRYDWGSVNNVKVTIANVGGGNLAGTLTGVFEPDVAKAKTYQVTFSQHIAVKAVRGAREGEYVRLEFKPTGAFTTTFASFAYLWPGASANVQTSTSLDVVEGQFNISMYPRKDYLAMAGSGAGTANVIFGGLTKLATWNGNINTTVSDFVTAHAAAFLAVGIVLTASTNSLIFTGVVGNKLAEHFAQPRVEWVSGTALTGINTQYQAGRLVTKAKTQDLR